MFEKYGEFDSYEEINKKAGELMGAGDEDGVRELAVENGLDVEDAEAYIVGEENDLCSAQMAAFGKLDLEKEDLEISGILDDWVGYIKDACVYDKELTAAVRKKGKKLAECMAALIRFAFENKVQVSDKIVDVTTITHNGKKEKMLKPLYLGVPNRTEARQIIRDYYMK